MALLLRPHSAERRKSRCARRWLHVVEDSDDRRQQRESLAELSRRDLFDRESLGGALHKARDKGEVLPLGRHLVARRGAEEVEVVGAADGRAGENDLVRRRLLRVGDEVVDQGDRADDLPLLRALAARGRRLRRAARFMGGARDVGFEEWQGAIISY